jgi:hypothetical protein
LTASRGNRYLYYYFTKRPEIYFIPKQEASTAAGVLVTNFFCHFGVHRELHQLGTELQVNTPTGVMAPEKLQMCTNPLHPPSDARLHLSLVTYQALTHKATGKTPVNLFGVWLLYSPNKEQFTTDYTADLMKQLHDTLQYAFQH